MADKTGEHRHHDANGMRASGFHQKSIRLNTKRGKWRMIIMISAHFAGA